jgi:hypothetical protein
MSISLHFNGTNSYCRIPTSSLSSATSWKATITLRTTDTTKYGNQVYNQPCIFGFDSGGYKSRDFHVDMNRGNLYIFTGLSGSNNSSQLNYGTLTNTNGDYGWNTNKSLADGQIHVIEIEASYTTKTVTVTLDDVDLGYLNIVNTINSSYLYLGCSQTGEKKYAIFDLFSFELEINGSLYASYQPTSTTVTDRYLTDSSGNNNNGTLYGTFSINSGGCEVTPKLFVTSISKELTTTPKLLVTTIPFQINITNTFDTSRNVVKAVTIEADTSREISDGTPIFLTADTKRSLSNVVTVNADTSRTIKSFTYVFASTLRMVLNEDKVQSSIGHNVLTLEPKTKVDSITTFDTVQNFDFNGGIELSGEYQIPASHRIYNENGTLAYVDMDIDAKAYNINQWLDFAMDFDTIMDFDGENIGAFITVTPYLRLSEDGVTFGDWQRLINGAQYKANYYDFKINLSTIDANTTVVVNKFGYTIHT